MSVKELKNEEKYINEMYDGLEREIQNRIEHTFDRYGKDMLEKQKAALKKGREARLAEWKLKADRIASESE